MTVKKFRAFAAAAFVAVSAAWTGCSSLSSALSTMGEIADDAGFGVAGAALGAGAAISKAGEEITPENEYYIGRSVAATILANYDVCESERLEEYLNLICAVLLEESDKPELFAGWHVKLLDTDEVNAFSTSGGHILVSRGLVGCAGSEDALAAVVAHEIAHVQLQHSLKAIKASRWTTALKRTAGAGLSAATGDTELADTLDGMVGDVVSQLVNNGYSKSQEFQADALALTLMANAGYDPAAMESMLKEMKSRQNGSKAGFYRTHPTPDERIENVRDSLGKIPRPKDTKKWRKKRFAAALEGIEANDAD